MRFVQLPTGAKAGRQDRRWRDHVYADVEFAQLGCQATRVFGEAGLGGRVDRAIAGAVQGVDAADGDDVARSALHHLGRNRAADQDAGHQVAVEDCLHVGQRHEDRVVRVGLAGLGCALVPPRRRYRRRRHGPACRSGRTLRGSRRRRGRRSPAELRSPWTASVSTPVVAGDFLRDGRERVRLVKGAGRGRRRAVDDDPRPETGQVRRDDAPQPARRSGHPGDAPASTLRLVVDISCPLASQAREKRCS